MSSAESRSEGGKPVGYYTESAEVKRLDRRHCINAHLCSQGDGMR